jgi:hypothetical protein
LQFENRKIRNERKIDSVRVFGMVEASWTAAANGRGWRKATGLGCAENRAFCQQKKGEERKGEDREEREIVLRDKRVDMFD